MPTELPEFPTKTKSYKNFLPLFDGKCWEVKPSEYGYDNDEGGAERLAWAIKYAAGKFKYYIRITTTTKHYVIVQRRPEDYVPKRVGNRYLNTNKKDENK
jgi:hypothetical protein